MPNSILDLPIVSRVRRNHGLEHATLNLLSRTHPGIPMAGYSTPSGFWIMGDVPLDDVYEAVEEALGRLQAGESKLAIHPNCGTNFITSGTMAGLAGAAVMFGSGKGWKNKLERLPLAASLATLALILSQPLGHRIQEKITTSGEPGTLKVVGINTTQKGLVSVYHVVTQG